MDKVNLYHGDCLIEHEHIEDGSVDLILTDLPYGTMNGFNGIDWDFAIAPDKIYKIADRILRKNGKLILFSQEPYTNKLISDSTWNLSFDYRMIWEKDSAGNVLTTNKAPLNFFEDILVFSKGQCETSIHPLRENMISYVKKYGQQYIVNLFEKEGRYTTSTSARTHASHKMAFNKGRRFDLMDFEMYKFLDKYLSFSESYDHLKEVDLDYKSKYSSVFNLPVGKKSKSNIFKYKKDGKDHPTQKPIALLEDLIKTFSDEGDLVVDLTMGSGSTGVACVNTNRKFAGVEMDDKYFDIAKQRISASQAQTNIFDFL